jgi:hypothetical protein
MVQYKDIVCADELLNEESRRADLARRVLDGRGGGISGGGRGGELGEVDGGEDPPALLELVQHNARLFCLDRVDILAAGEGS